MTSGSWSWVRTRGESRGMGGKSKRRYLPLYILYIDTSWSSRHPDPPHRLRRRRLRLCTRGSSPARSPPATSLPSDLTASNTNCVSSSRLTLTILKLRPPLSCPTPADLPCPGWSALPKQLGVTPRTWPLATTTMLMNSSSASSWTWTLPRGRWNSVRSPLSSLNN